MRIRKLKTSKPSVEFYCVVDRVFFCAAVVQRYAPLRRLVGYTQIKVCITALFLTISHIHTTSGQLCSDRLAQEA